MMCGAGGEEVATSKKYIRKDFTVENSPTAFCTFKNLQVRKSFFN
jgi:hypothetical protein